MRAAPERISAAHQPQAERGIVIDHTTAPEIDFHPALGMRWEITHSSEETSGELFRSMNWLDPHMPGPPPHVHPHQEESFEVFEGTLDVFVDGRWTQVRAGETATVAPGRPHTLRNATDETIKVATAIRPAGTSEAFFRDMIALIEAGKLKRLPPKEPRSAIYAAMLFAGYPDWIRATGAPGRVFAILARMGRVLRFELPNDPEAA
jgi:mannose-6-phosphate isomerase-like protein (cupin superfamily)